MQERNFINLGLDELKEIILNYYKQKLGNNDLQIESRLETCFTNKEVKFTISTIKSIEPKMTMNIKYDLNNDDVINILSEHLSGQNYEISDWRYKFYETKDEVKNIHLIVQKKKQNKLTRLKEIRNQLLFSKSKPTFLTAKEMKDILVNGEDMPTAIFNADKKEYIVKPRTIFGVMKK